MDLRITENYQLLKREATAHWKTGVVMTAAAVVVGRVYGRTAAWGIVLITISNYQIIGKQIRILTWSSLRKTLIAVVLFGNSYYTVINPQIMSYIAVVLVLVDNFQLSTLNEDLSTQIETLLANNAKIQEADNALINLEQELLKIQGAGKRIEAAEKTKEAVVVVLEQTIPERIKNLPTRLQSVAILLKEFTNSKERKELAAYKEDLKTKISAMLDAFKELTSELQPLTAQVEGLSENLETTFTNMQTNVVLTSRQLTVLRDVIQQLKKRSL